MTVQRFVQPDYSAPAQDGSTYPTYLDRAINVFKRTGDWFAPHQVYAGSPQPDLAVELDAGWVWNGTTLTEKAAQTVSGFTIPSAGQHRIDRVVVDASTGAATRVAGTAVTGSPSAVAPAIPAGKIPICQVLITSADTAVLDSMITDERVLVTSASGISALGKAIYGLTYANNAGDATNDIDIAAGGAMDATGAYSMTLAAITKRLDAAWAVGTAQGGLDTGAIGDSDYHIWLIARSDTGVVDVLFSLSSTGPTMPANYDYKRLIGFFKRVGGAIVAFKTYETEGGGIDLLWSSPTLDADLAATLTTSRRTDAVKAPLTFSVLAFLNVIILDATAGTRVWIYCPDQTDLAPSQTAAPLANAGNVGASANASASQLSIRTSATGTIAARADIATVDAYRVATMGFRMSRR